MKASYRVGPGASSLLLIFVVLALTTLGALSLTGAMSDRRMAERSAAMTETYYEAAADAQAYLRQIDAALYDAWASGADGDSYRAAAEGLDFGDARAVCADGTIEFSLDAGAGRALRVSLRLTPLSEGGARYEITRFSLDAEAVIME